jgi:hypothetical protein
MRRFALALCVASGLGLLLFPTAGTPSQQAIDTDNLELSSSPNSNYVTETDGTVVLDLTRRHAETGKQIGLNDRAVTTFDRLFQIKYDGSETVTVWLETPVSGAQFYHEEQSQAIDEPGAVELTEGEVIYVGLVLDTTDPESRINQFDQFEVNIGGTADNDEVDSTEVPVNTPPADGSIGGEGDTDPEPPDNDEPDSGGDGEPESPAEDGPNSGEGEPESEPPGDDGQDSPPEQPNSPPSDPTSDGPVPENSIDTTDPNTGTSDPSPELGETPDESQTALSGLRWVLLLVAGGIIGLSVGAAARRLSMQQ